MAKRSRHAAGYDNQWARLSKAHLKRFPICAVMGCGRPAAIADHIATIKAAPALRLHPGNLQSLCLACHNRLTAAYDRASIRGACDAAGRPLDPSHPWQAANNQAAIAAANLAPTPPPAGLSARLKRSAVRGRLSKHSD